MAVESKPPFHPEVIRQHVRSFELPERVKGLTPRLQHWAELIASGRADDFKETDLFSVVAARAKGARRLRRFRVAHFLERCGIPARRELRTVKRTCRRRADPLRRRDRGARAAHWYLISVAAGVPPAVEPGILPGGLSCGRRLQFRAQRCHCGRQDAVLY